MGPIHRLIERHWKSRTTSQSENLEVQNVCAFPPELNQTHEKVWESEQIEGGAS